MWSHTGSSNLDFPFNVLTGLFVKIAFSVSGALDFPLASFAGIFVKVAFVTPGVSTSASGPCFWEFLVVLTFLDVVLAFVGEFDAVVEVVELGVLTEELANFQKTQTWCF